MFVVMKKIIASVLVITVCLSCLAQVPSVRTEDKIRIAEAIIIRDQVGETIWSGVSQIPLVLLLVTNDFEYLFNHPYPSEDFKWLEEDAITGSNIYYRETTLPLYFQATFPAVNGVNCIVMGIPENTNIKSSNWVLTVLHENFHQYQESIPYYYELVNDLKLSGGDTTGMWMINYPFPYENSAVNMAFRKYSDSLLTAVQNFEKENFNTYLSEYQKARVEFRESLTDEEYRYFSFQLWKEGIARYTEYKYLNALSEYTASKNFQKLADAVPFSEMKHQFVNNELQKIQDGKLSEMKREIIYPLGLAEGVLLDKINLTWHKNYFLNKFNIHTTR